MARFELDPAYTHIGFTAKHMMVSTVRGSFSDWSGYVEVEDNDPNTARAEVTVKAASLNSGSDDRDKHLRSEDFLNVDNHPDITYRSGAVEKVDDSHYKVAGELTIRTLTRPVTLDFEVGEPFQDGWGNERVGISATGKINRKDWGLEGNMIMEGVRRA